MMVVVVAMVQMKNQVMMVLIHCGKEFGICSEYNGKLLNLLSKSGVN